jgi:hypothetical protein
MAQFVLVSSGIGNSQFEKSMEIMNRSDGRVRFVPQAVQNQNGVTTPGMSSHKPVDQAPDQAGEILNAVRFEWTESGADFGSEIVKVLAL